ncbi:DUF1624 domain-containing protein [Candidatus Gracilibacteria bacterium]|nr:DUF1624 domain-containing protein [Candidatus Gracilibacteria bacterium]
MRIELLDILRGLALLAMIAFHANYISINLFGGEVRLFSEGAWQNIGFAIGVSFIALSGYVNAYTDESRSIGKNLVRGWKRALFLALIALSISIVTYVFFYEERISWGIIHFFALASLLQPIFSKMGNWIWLAVVLIFLISDTLTRIRGDTWYLIPFGISSENYYSADYYPLFPWFGYMLFGQGCHVILRKFGIEHSLTRIVFPRLKLLGLLGKHSLLVYVLHVPVLYVLFSCIFWVLSLV